MKIQNILSYTLLPVILFFSNCSSISTKVQIKERRLPDSFPETPRELIKAESKYAIFNDSALVQLIDTVIAENIDLQIALQKIEIARALKAAANGSLFPQIGPSLKNSVQKYGHYTMDGAGNASTEIIPGKTIPTVLPDFYAGLQMSSWEIDVWGKLRKQKKAANARYLASIEGANFVVSNLVIDVALAYYELIALDTELEILKQNIEKQSEALNVILLKKDAGRVSELAVQQFKAELLSSQALEYEILQQITETENRINFLAGRFTRRIIRNKETLQKKPLLSFPVGTPETLLSNRPDIREAERLIQASHFDLASAKASLYPMLSLTAGLGYQSFSLPRLFFSPASLAYHTAGNLIAPLINRKALKAQFKSAKSNQISSLYHYQKTTINAYFEVVNILSGIRNLEQINTLKEQQNEALIMAVDASFELYKSAKASYLEVLLAQQNLLRAQREYISNRKQLHINAVNLYRALGGGWN